MDPEGVLVDFEEALANAFQDVFPNCEIWHDFFHFQQANIRKLKKLGLSDIIGEVIADTHLLWKSNSKAKFDENVDKFFSKWNLVIPPYTAYFRKTWLTRFKPELWAFFARPKNAPSGSAALEGQHSRWQNCIFPNNPLHLDKIVHILWGEDQYYSKVASSPDLWIEKRRTNQNEKTKNQNRLKRATLTNYAPLDKSEVDSPMATETSRKRKQLEDDDSEEEKREVGKLLRKDLCECGKFKKNKDCSLKKCKKCCVTSTQYCYVPDHNKDKPYVSKESMPSAPNETVKRLSLAMENDEEIYISYNGGTMPLVLRKVKPVCWLKNDYYQFTALCFHTKPPKPKTFDTYKVERIADHMDEQTENYAVAEQVLI